ncbi:MAG: helix-turn-helix domain-containing protein [Promicromonosporaceae bacterium]|nr:helix-turn-helix domain-containing protein [Promicromonosporaceae bacterium]
MCDTLGTQHHSIRERRRLRGLSQTDFAEEVGLTRQTLSDRERGRVKWQPVELARVAQFFRDTLENVMAGEGISPTAEADADSAVAPSRTPVPAPQSVPPPPGFKRGRDGRVIPLGRDVLDETRERVRALVAVGWSVEVIAAELGRSPRLVRADITALRAEGHLPPSDVGSTVSAGFASTVQPVADEPLAVIAGSASASGGAV